MLAQQIKDNARVYVGRQHIKALVVSKLTGVRAHGDNMLADCIVEAESHEEHAATHVLPCGLAVVLWMRN